MSTRKFESGSSKRKKKQRIEELIQSQKGDISHQEQMSMILRKKFFEVEVVEVLFAVYDDTREA
ncbi:hypothetical protein LINGRAHAP2_LOCUS2272 [Linum grandiflorum]